MHSILYGTFVFDNSSVRGQFKRIHGRGGTRNLICPGLIQTKKSFIINVQQTCTKIHKRSKINKRKLQKKKNPYDIKVVPPTEVVP